MAANNRLIEGVSRLYLCVVPLSHVLGAGCIILRGNESDGDSIDVGQRHRLGVNFAIDPLLKSLTLLKASCDRQLFPIKVVHDSLCVYCTTAAVSLGVCNQLTNG